MLVEEKRQQLDSIVQQMTQNNESDDSIQFVVNDFKNRYEVQEPETSFLEKTENVLDVLFGGGKVGEAIGAGIAKTKTGRKLIGAPEIPEEAEKFIEAPSISEVAGSALQSAALFTPVGTLAKGITAGAKGLGLVKGITALGKIGAGALTGEIFDVALNLQQGKMGKDALTPGLGTLLGGGIPAVGVAKNVVVRFGEKQAPRVINSLVRPLLKDLSYGKNPGRAVAEEGIVANNFDDLVDKIRASRQSVGKAIGELGDTLSTTPIIHVQEAVNPLNDAIKIAAKQNNATLLNRLNNVKRAITEVLEPVADEDGNLSIKSVGHRNLENLTFKQTRNLLGEIGDMTQFTGNPSDDKLVNSALKKVYGKIKEISLKYAEAINPSLAKQFSKLTEKYADLTSAEIATKYRDKIVERQNLIGFSPKVAGVGSAIITAIATGGATIPTLLVGVSSAVIDKLASTPAFKTRLAYMLSKKTTQEANFLFSKVPALRKFFSTEKGIFPGDIIIGDNGEVLERGIAEFIKKPKIGLSIEDVSGLGQTLRGTKGMTAQDIMQKFPDIQLKRDVPATDIYGNKIKIPEGEALTPYELKGNKVLLQDGGTYIVSKNQYQNIKGQSVSAGEFADVSPRAVEARKYKSAEEYVKGQFQTTDLPPLKKITDRNAYIKQLGFKQKLSEEFPEEWWAKNSTPNQYYHIGEEEIMSFDKSKSRFDASIRGGGISQINGLYLGRDPKALGKFYGMIIRDELGKTPTISSFKMAPKWLDLSNVADETKFLSEVARKYGVRQGRTKSFGDALEKEIIERGYDGVRYFDPYATGEEFILVKEPKVQSQLTDLWNKAQKTKAKIRGEAPEIKTSGKSFIGRKK